MIHRLAIELPDEVHEHVLGMAAKTRLSPEDWVIERLVTITPQSKFLSPAELAEARENFKRHGGAVSIADSTNANNEHRA